MWTTASPFLTKSYVQPSLQCVMPVVTTLLFFLLLRQNVACMFVPVGDHLDKGFVIWPRFDFSNSFCDIIFSLMRKLCYAQYINYNKNLNGRWHSGGVVVHILWSKVQFQYKFFISRLLKCMNSFNTRIHLYYEFIYFLQWKINDFIYFCSAK